MENIMSEAVSAAFGIAIFVGIILQAVKQLESVNNKYLPLMSIVLGVVIGIVFAIAFGFDVAVYTIAGFLGGASASGIYDGLAIVKGGK